MKQEILVEIGGILTLRVYKNNIQAIPTVPKITIYDNAGNEKIAQTSASVDAEGTMTYNVQGSDVEEVAYNWKAKWKYTLGSDTGYQEQLFDIVNRILVNPVQYSDLIDRARFLDELNYREILIATGGSDTTIESTELNQDDHYWNGSVVKIIAGTNAGESRRITAFASGVLTVSPAFTNPIDTTSKFELIRSFEREISQAFDNFKLDLINKGLKPNRIIDNSQTAEYIKLKAIQLICENFTRVPADIWNERAENYKEQYNTKMKVAKFDYDKDDSGYIDSDEAGFQVGQPRAVR